MMKKEATILVKDLSKIGRILKTIITIIFVSAAFMIPILNAIVLDQMLYDQIIDAKKGKEYVTLFGQRTALHKEEKK